MGQNSDVILNKIQKEILIKLIETDHELKMERDKLEKRFPGWISNPNLENDFQIFLCLDLLQKSTRSSIVHKVLNSFWKKRKITYSDIKTAFTVWNNFQLQEIAKSLYDNKFEDFCLKNKIYIDIKGSENTIRNLAKIAKKDPKKLSGSIWCKNSILDGTHRCLAMTLVFMKKGNLLPVNGFFSIDSNKS